MTLLRRGATALTPKDAGWRYVGFEVVRLAGGEALARETLERELCLVWLSGTCEVETPHERWATVGQRRTVFDGPPHAVYVPPKSWVSLRASRDGAEIAIGSAPASHGARARHFAGAPCEVRGSGAMEREVYHVLMEEREAERLLVSEVFTPAGHWSSYPPHKHDTEDLPREAYLEETYYFRLRDLRGFALERVYTKDGSLDEAIAARDGDLVLVPKGYHTVSAAPGYDCYYLNVMAGPARTWAITFDPDHERMKW